MAVTADVERGRTLFAAAQWREAHECLGSIAEALGPDDLEMLARSAYLLGMDDEYVEAMERAHDAWLEQREISRAARCCFWIGHSLMFRGQGAHATGWFSRARRSLGAGDCVEQGYLLAPTWLDEMGRGDWADGLATAVRGSEIGEQFGDADLVWLARADQARALLHLGRTSEGRRLVDEALVVTESGDLSPVVRGIVYCNTIAFCRDLYELDHARAWTEALAEWCDEQPQMITHHGLCRVHRAEVMQYAGEWAAALHEASEVQERFRVGMLNEIALGQALYRQGEICRLQGRLAEAGAAFHEAGLAGHDPQPGLAMLRLAQGARDVAASMVRRSLSEHAPDLERAGLIPAFVRVMLAIGDFDAAETAARQLREIAERQQSPLLSAMATQAGADVALAAGDAAPALSEARRAVAAWRQLGVPYETACGRLRVRDALRLMGDDESAAVEDEAARKALEALGASPAIAGLGEGSRDRHGLTPRELEVLGHLARGDSNRDIAVALTISEHTVARHVQNILGKLDVSSRAAAAAFAFEHHLL
jgi:DNA-binding NarL/FixJ family response regulator